jgi:hypothetical protein
MTDLAFLLGGSAELALDPLDIIFGLLIGLAASKWWHRLLAAAIVAIAVTAMVRLKSEFQFDASPVLITTFRFIAISAWAILGWAGRALSQRAARSQSSSGSD